MPQIKMNKFRTIFIFAVMMIFPVSDSYSFSDQTTSERILKENRNFLEYINISTTNFKDQRNADFKKIYETHYDELNKARAESGEKEDKTHLEDKTYTAGEYKKALFKKAYELHFNADVAYLQSDYKRTYKRIYSSQELLYRLYEGILYSVYLEDSKEILDSIAPTIIKSKNARARLYLTLGYRDRTVAWNYYTVGEASNPRLYSYKIYQYQEGISMARRAKRYAFLALFECQPPEAKRKIFNQLMKKEKEAGRIFFSRFIDLSDENYIKEMSKTYEEYEKENEKRTEAAAATKDSKEFRGTDNFESIVELRVRFKNEQRAAKLLLDNDFDQAEDIIRKYVEEYNYKLISATFDALKGDDKSKETSAIDYSKFFIHHQDNYTKLTDEKKTVLNEVLNDVKVEDDVLQKKEGNPSEKSDANSAPKIEEKKDVKPNDTK